MLTLVQFVIGSMSLALAPVPKLPSTVLDKLQGRWIMTAAREKSKVIDLEGEVRFEMIVEKDHLTISRRDEKYEFKIKLDPSKKPATIDLIIDHAKNDPKINYAIYRLDKDDFQLGFNDRLRPNSEKDRPPDFEYRRSALGCFEYFIFTRRKQ